MQKKCFKCGKIKHLSMFYKHKKMADGHLNKCKECTKQDAIAHRDKNIEKVREYDRKRSKNPERVKMCANNTALWRKKHAKRYRCHVELNNAVRDGIVKKTPCFICGNEKSEAHHPDYDQPLSVVWLCSAHHKEIHLRKPCNQQR